MCSNINEYLDNPNIEQTNIISRITEDIPFTSVNKACLSELSMY